MLQIVAAINYVLACCFLCAYVCDHSCISSVKGQYATFTRGSENANLLNTMSVSATGDISVMTKDFKQF